MQWQEIRNQYPDQFILIGDLVEEAISDHEVRILEGSVILASKDPKEIQKAYQECKSQGKEVLYSLPSTSDDFIVENIKI